MRSYMLPVLVLLGLMSTSRINAQTANFYIEGHADQPGTFMYLERYTGPLGWERQVDTIRVLENGKFHTDLNVSTQGTTWLRIGKKSYQLLIKPGSFIK